MRVLIIDDDPDLRNLLVHYIRQQWPAGDIEEYDPLERGMPDEKYSLATYDVIILDYMLGRGDGLQWLSDFKKRGDCPPIIFLTGAGNESIAVGVPPPAATAGSRRARFAISSRDRSRRSSATARRSVVASRSRSAPTARGCTSARRPSTYRRERSPVRPTPWSLRCSS